LVERARLLGESSDSGEIAGGYGVEDRCGHRGLLFKWCREFVS